MGHLEKTQKVPISMEAGPETMPVKKDLEQRSEERVEMWYKRQFTFQGHPQGKARQASPGLSWVQVSQSGGKRRDQEALKVPPDFFF